MHFTGNAGFQGEQLSRGGWVARALWYFRILCFIPKPTHPPPFSILYASRCRPHPPGIPPCQRYSTPTVCSHKQRLTPCQWYFIFYILYFIFGDSRLSVHQNHSRTRSASKPEASCHPDNRFLSVAHSCEQHLTPCQMVFIYLFYLETNASVHRNHGRTGPSPNLKQTAIPNGVFFQRRTQASNA